MYDMEASLAWRAPTSAPAKSAGSVRNEPGGLNSSVVLSASPAASPSRQPRNRSRSAAPPRDGSADCATSTQSRPSRGHSGSTRQSTDRPAVPGTLKGGRRSPRACGWSRQSMRGSRNTSSRLAPEGARDRGTDRVDGSAHDARSRFRRKWRRCIRSATSARTCRGLRVAGCIGNTDATAGTHSDVRYGGLHRYRQNPKLNSAMTLPCTSERVPPPVARRWAASMSSRAPPAVLARKELHLPVPHVCPFP